MTDPIPSESNVGSVPVGITLMNTLKVHTRSMAWSPDGTRFASCSDSVRLWDTKEVVEAVREQLVIGQI